MSVRPRSSSSSFIHYNPQKPPACCMCEDHTTLPRHPVTYYYPLCSDCAKELSLLRETPVVSLASAIGCGMLVLGLLVLILLLTR